MRSICLSSCPDATVSVQADLTRKHEADEEHEGSFSSNYFMFFIGLHVFLWEFSAAGMTRSRSFALLSTPGTPAPGCVPAPTR